MAPKTDEAKAWYGAVYAAVQQIPYGKVTSYAHIAYLVGHRKSGIRTKSAQSENR
ncbi:MAG: MGMT family protein [Terriglobus roseus]|nr:MGMT family protein [Terriglobus roseus]